MSSKSNGCAFLLVSKPSRIMESGMTEPDETPVEQEMFFDPASDDIEVIGAEST